MKKALIVTTLLVLLTQLALAGSSTWNLNPTSNDWNTAANWTPATVPHLPADTATFGLSNLTSVSLQTAITISGITFNSGASPFTIAVGASSDGSGGPTNGTLTMQGPGVINNSAKTQHFVTTGFSSDFQSFVSFSGSASAGSNVVYNNMPLSNLNFSGTSSAAEAAIVNHAGSLGSGVGGVAFTRFLDNSTAGNATITNESDEGIGGLGGLIQFFNDSTAGNAFFTNKSQAPLGCLIIFGDNSTAGTATFINEGNDDNAGAAMQFNGTSSADHGTFTFEPGAPSRTSSASKCDFQESATAGNATFTIQGSTAAGAPPATLTFNNTSTAGNSTLIATSGPAPNTGGIITFLALSQGGTARIELSGPTGRGTLTIASHNAPGITIGSLEGAGLVVLGARDLTIGSNNLSTTFSGVIQDGPTGPGGSLFKIGTGTLTLTGANTYTGPTVVADGILVVSNQTGSGTGTGVVQANIGLLGGSGIIAGGIIVGTGSGPGAVLAPAAGSRVQATLTTQGRLTLLTDGIYKCTAQAKGARARTDSVIANGVTITNAQFSFRPKISGTLRTGTVFTVISNTSLERISGTFSNLPDGAILTVGGVNFQANYEGGDGNDLTLTVVP
jgi:autotransporter-associated beta strand protein